MLIGGKISGTVEIVRSFSYKLNAGNYESRDFFCSMKAQCSAEEREAISAAVHDFCKHVVLEDVRAYKRLMDEQRKKETT